VPTEKQDKVIPDSLQIVLNQYLKKPEVKSLAPDGTPCSATTQGLLRRVQIVAAQLIAVGKEADRRWEQGEDPSMLDFETHLYEDPRHLRVGDASERRRWSQIGVRRLMRESALTQKAVYKILKGDLVRPQTLATFRRAVENFHLDASEQPAIRTPG